MASLGALGAQGWEVVICGRRSGNLTAVAASAGGVPFVADAASNADIHRPVPLTSSRIFGSLPVPQVALRPLNPAAAPLSERHRRLTDSPVNAESPLNHREPNSDIQAVPLTGHQPVEVSSIPGVTSQRRQPKRRALRATGPGSDRKSDHRQAMQPRPGQPMEKQNTDMPTNTRNEVPGPTSGHQQKRTQKGPIES